MNTYYSPSEFVSYTESIRYIEGGMLREQFDWCYYYGGTTPTSYEYGTYTFSSLKLSR